MLLSADHGGHSIASKRGDLMRTTIRRAGVACGTALASLAIALSTATGAWASNSAVVIGGIGAGSMSDLLMAPLLGGALKGQERVNVNWPAQAGPMTGTGDLTLGASIDIGITNLTAAIDTALGEAVQGRGRERDQRREGHRGRPVGRLAGGRRGAAQHDRRRAR